MARRGKKDKGTNGEYSGVGEEAPDLNGPEIGDYRFPDKRKNTPPAKIAAEGRVPRVDPIQYAYSPRRDPRLRFDDTGAADRLPELLVTARQRALTEDEARVLAEALRHHEPWLEWAGKRESKGFTVDPVALHMHERISAQAIIKVAARQDVTRDLFADPQQEYREAVQFYQHDIDWTNRLILGDSLQVMASLAHREDLAGKVQMIYIDPPYGIRFGSNFQPELGKCAVTDKEVDLIREPEMVKAYRDIWHLGIHSYLAYLRERLVLSREMLHDTGSIFVQISDENVHRVRLLLDEVFSETNFCALIPFSKTSGQTPTLLSSVCDYLLWYAKDKAKIVFNAMFREKPPIKDPSERYVCVEKSNGEIIDLPHEAKASGRLPPGVVLRLRDCTSQTGSDSSRVPFAFQGMKCIPTGSRGWSSPPNGLVRAARSERLHLVGNSLRWKNYYEDAPYREITGAWVDFSPSGFGEKRAYVVQTAIAVIERCVLMTTKPGDIILDPTCGSGTTAYVAEQWGRRWIAIDTSRVAVAIARQRLLTAKFDFYEVNGAKGDMSTTGQLGTDPHPGFIYKTVPHITLKSIAQNNNLDPIIAQHDQILEARLSACNAALADVPATTNATLQAKLALKEKTEGKRSITDADRRRWLLPPSNRDPKVKLTVDARLPGWYHWEVPFDTDPDYPALLSEAISAYRAAWRAKMEEVNACISANATAEELVDQPLVRRGVVRVSGPFTVEAIQPPEVSLSDALEPDGAGLFEGEPDALADTFAEAAGSGGSASGEAAATNAAAYLDRMLRLLRMDGIRFPDNLEQRFSRLEPLSGQGVLLHAEGRWAPAGQTDPDPEGPATVGVVVGPQYGSVTAKMVEEIIRPAGRVYDDLVIAAFSFDGPAQAAIEEGHPRLRIHMAHIRPDVNPAMDGLLKEQPGAQLFSVFGQPRTRLEGPDDQGEYRVFMDGVDIYNPVTNEITPSRGDKVAAWFLDSDYDGRTFCITQAFFPDRSAWDKLARALKTLVDAERFAALSGTESLPFPVGPHRRVAVKVIDPRGNEVMQVHRLGGGDGD